MGLHTILMIGDGDVDDLENEQRIPFCPDVSFSLSLFG